MMMRTQAKLVGFSLALSAAMPILWNTHGVAAIATKQPPLSARAIIRVLLANADVPLRGISSCGSVKDPADKTVGDYVATVFSRLAEPSTTWRMQPTFTTLGKAGQKHWRIRVSLQGSDAGDVFDTGVTFDFNEKTAKMIKGSFQCSGTM